MLGRVEVSQSAVTHLVAPPLVTDDGTFDGSVCSSGGALALTAELRGTILNYTIFIGHYRGQPIRQPIKNDVFGDRPTQDRSYR